MKNEGRGADGRREPQFSARYCKRAKKSVSKNNHEIAVRNGTKKKFSTFLENESGIQIEAQLKFKLCHQKKAAPTLILDESHNEYSKAEQQQLSLARL